MVALSSLASAFPTNVREEFCLRKLKLGAVFRTLSLDTRPPKIKIFVVIGFSGDEALIAALYVNTVINPNVNFDDKLKDLHLLLKKDDHPSFLTHDSYLDCAHLIEKDKTALYTAFNADTGMFVGEIPAPLLSQVIEMVASAHTIAKNKKKQFGII